MSAHDGTIRFALGIWAGQDEQLARRLQHLLIGVEAGFVPYHKPGGAWQIDSANNWLLRIEDGEAVLQYRYPSAKTTVQWAALCIAVGMLLDVEIHLEGQSATWSALAEMANMLQVSIAQIRAVSDRVRADKALRNEVAAVGAMAMQLTVQVGAVLLSAVPEAGRSTP